MLTLPDDTLPPSHESLVRLAQAGNVAAFEILFTYYVPHLSRYLSSKVRSPQDADDLVQETFAKAWRGLECLEQATKFKSWLYRIATNAVYDHMRSQKSQQRLALVSLEQSWETCALLHDGHCFEEDVAEGDLVKRALQELPWKERQSLLLDISGNRSRGEIAQRVAISSTSVGVYLSKGREHLRQAYQRLALDSCGDLGRESEGRKPYTTSRQQADSGAEEREHTMNRRAFFRQALALSLVFAAPHLRPDLLRFTEALTAAPTAFPIEEELSLMKTLTQACWQLLPHRAKQLDHRSLDYIRSYRHVLKAWLDHSSGTPAIQLAEALSEVALVEGWLLHALNRQYEAEQVCQEAILVAHRAGNIQLEAIGVTWLSNFLIDTGHADRVVDRLQAARRKAEKAGAIPLLRAWMAATEADTLANLRAGYGYRAAYLSEGALERAAALTPSGASEAERYPIPYDTPWLHGYRGAVYAHLGHDARKAQSELEQGLATLDPALLFRRWGFYHDLIIAHSLGEQVEQACQYARLAMSVAEQTQAPVFLRRVQDTAYQCLTRWKESPLVRDLLEEIRLAQQKLAMVQSPDVPGSVAQ